MSRSCKWRARGMSAVCTGSAPERPCGRGAAAVVAFSVSTMNVERQTAAGYCVIIVLDD